MGQYYKAVNLTKKQVIRPHAFGDGAKLMEFGSSGSGMMCALAILLADGNNRGCGDLRADDELIGSWAGDKIVITGDYADEGRFGSGKKTLYQKAENFKDISIDIMEVMCKDPYIKKNLYARTGWREFEELCPAIQDERRKHGRPMDDATVPTNEFRPDIMISLPSTTNN